ncbi:MAG: hypothetical protein HOB26_02525 [Flavobacteriales bacterium]|jgi:hypothetical protein|nr:hypothetical protein [Flavobacteriales bacterium]MBT6745414.1 hypothetical protein [Flavobacteriales bacterium]
MFRVIRKRKYLTFLIAVLISSCSTTKNEDEIIGEVKPMDGLTSELILDSVSMPVWVNGEKLSKKQLEILEEKAIRKVNDLANYLRVMADSTISTKNRERAYDKALADFGLLATVSTEDIIMPTRLFLQYVLAIDTSYGEYSITNIQIANNITSITKEGVLHCQITGIDKHTAHCSIDFTLHQNSSEERKHAYWDIRLGDIALIE